MNKCFIDDVLNIPPPKSARKFDDSISKQDSLNVYESYENLPPLIAPEPEPALQEIIEEKVFVEPPIRE